MTSECSFTWVLEPRQMSFRSMKSMPLPWVPEVSLACFRGAVVGQDKQIMRRKVNVWMRAPETLLAKRIQTPQHC